MARKKKDRESHSGPYNPYFGKFEDESQMAKRPFFTWILIVPGAVLGVFIGMKVQEPVLGPVFGGIMGIAVGSLIDKKNAGRRERSRRSCLKAGVDVRGDRCPLPACSREVWS